MLINIYEAKHLLARVYSMKTGRSDHLFISFAISRNYLCLCRGPSWVIHLSFLITTALK
jgi:hypothetical protein